MTVVRAVCHIHSDWSDGKWSLEKLVKVFGRFGVQVLMMTEHERGFNESRWAKYRMACKKASTNRVQLIPGLEYSEKTNAIHVLVWGDIPFLGVEMDTGKLLRQVAKYGGVAVLAHPGSESALKIFTNKWDKYLAGLEIWNRKADGLAVSSDAQKWFKDNGRNLLPFVGLDFHCPKQLWPLVMKFELEPPATESNILSAIRQGRCFPTAWGLPLRYFTSGVGAIVAKYMEITRKICLRRPMV